MEDIVIKVEPSDFLMDTDSYDISQQLVEEPDESDATLTDVKQEIFEEEQQYDSLGEFCFESDHLALKGNTDYKNLLEAVVVLEAQRAKAIKDLDRLLECQEEALADPIGFVEKLQRKEDLKLPGPQRVVQLPTIDWSKYALGGNAAAFGKRQLTRLATKSITDSKPSNSKSKKLLEQAKSAKLNQYWTAEEQKRLEELLIQFPPEEVESRRWEKIANCLENRTPTQVASRVQKYFIKLLKAGIPIPGRMPNISYLKKPRRNVIRQQPSTFLVSHTLPVHMPDGEDDYHYNYSQSLSGDENSRESKDDALDDEDDEDISPELRNTPEFRELLLLKKVQKEKLKSCGLAQHVGFKCCRCNCEPIIGVRWHCVECKPPMTVDFCDDCVECMHESGHHTADHKIEAVHNAKKGYLDRDYMHFLGSDYNYLDPNYMPAT